MYQSSPVVQHVDMSSIQGSPSDPTAAQVQPVGQSDDLGLGQPRGTEREGKAYCVIDLVF